MDNKTKLISAAILALSASVAVAGGYSCSAQNVAIPCDTNGWHFLAEGAYVQPTNDDLEYYRSGDGPSVQHAVRPDHEFAWRVEGGWHYDHGRDITVSWSRFDHRYSDSTDYFGLNDGGDDDPAEFRRWVANANFEVDIFNLEFGQMFNVGDKADMRLHFGAQFVGLNHYLKHELKSAGIVDDPDKSGDKMSLGGNKYPSDFDGFGPRIGIDWYYHLSDGFQFTSHAAMALLVDDLAPLVGDIEANDVSSTDVSSPTIAKFSRRTIVPHLEGRAGVRYNHKLDQGLLSVEGGWHVAGIYQSIHHVNPAKGRPLQNISNYGNHGPFLNIMFAAAA